MASRSRNQVVKADISGTIADRIPTFALIPERYDALYYEVLKGLDLQNLPTHKQIAAILFAACTCNIVCLTDCRSLVTDSDYQEKLVQHKGIDDYYNQFFKLFDKLNAGATREQSKTEEQTNIGETLQDLIAKHGTDDMRSNPSQ